MKKPSKNSSISVLFVLLIIITCAVIVIDLILPVEDFTMKYIFSTLIGKNINPDITYLLNDVRWPRVVTTLMVGAGLSVAGLLLQTLFHNPLAGPYVLGISSGAGLGVAVYVMASASFLGLGALFTAGGQIMAALIGAFVVFVLVISFSWRLSNSVSLLIVGMMIGSLTTAIVGILQYFANPDTVHKFVIWSLGSLGATGWEHLKLIVPFVFIAILLSVSIVKSMDVLLLGEMHAKVAGINVRRTRLIMIIIASILAGTLTAFTGPIAFIGMTVPHITRLITGKVSHKIILPGVMITGALLLYICDIIAQMPGKSTTLPINSVTAIFGAPVVVFLIVHNRRIKATF